MTNTLEAQWTSRTNKEPKKGWHIFDPLEVDYRGLVCRLESEYDNEEYAHLFAAAPAYGAAAQLAINVLENDKQVIHAKKYQLEHECDKCKALDALYAAREKARGQS